MLKKLVIIPLASFALILAGCNLPQTSSPTPNGASAAFTQSAQTVEARLTELASFNTPAATVETVPPTPIQLATFTPARSPSNTPIVATVKRCHSDPIVRCGELHVRM